MEILMEAFGGKILSIWDLLHHYQESDENPQEQLRRLDSKSTYFLVRCLMQEELIDLQNDSNLKSSFEYSTNLEEFWCKKAMGYSKIRQTALRFLMVFSTTYLCEQGFSSLLSIKNKQRNRLNPSDDMRLALSNSIVPRISQLVKEARPNKSH
ncbi:protein ZBED8-like [Myzus persicae]|uniref:protein ZBED8-like n=1 Tax=Myzus persicae TaxID=13164 RepID=UPI000B933AC6|nr:protein ZBED8-like [Myzus persicae]